MKKHFTNFVLKTLHKAKRSLKRTDEGGRTIRYSRFRKFRRKNKGLSVFAQVIAIWYLGMFAATYFTSDTGAYFNDVESISGTISAAADYCAEAEEDSEFWKKYCEELSNKHDNSGIGNGPDTSDQDTGEGTDPDNPGHNKDDCDDHTSANCSEKKKISNLKENHTSNSVTLTWSNPTFQKFTSVTVFRDGTEVSKNIVNGQYEDEALQPSTRYSYKLVAFDKTGEEMDESIIEVTTTATTEQPEEETSKDQTEEQPAGVDSDETQTDTTAPAEVTNIKTQSNGANITFNWINPADSDFAYVKIYLNGNEEPIEKEVTDITVSIKQKPKEKATYRITTVDTYGNESPGTLVTVNQ
ncbi:hypothetical protein [Bacillus sp. AK031]